MNYSVASVFLAICLVTQGKIISKSPAITLRDYYNQSNEEGRIISGQPAQRGQFPYQVAIWMNWPQGGQSFCGGTLISSRWVLTAAHCADGVASWDIKLGGLNIDKNEAGSLLLHSTKGIVHPRYNILIHNDVALIELPREVTFTDRIQPLRLASRSDPTVGAGVRARVSGWGKINDSAVGVSPYLSYVDVDTISNADCAQIYGPLLIINSTLCTKGRSQHSPCNGDSGGPLTITASDGLPTHAGVVSFVSTNGCASGSPSGYARSARFLDWISQNTGIPIRNAGVGQYRALGKEFTLGLPLLLFVLKQIKNILDTY